MSTHVADTKYTDEQQHQKIFAEESISLNFKCFAKSCLHHY